METAKAGVNDALIAKLRWRIDGPLHRICVWLTILSVLIPGPALAVAVYFGLNMLGTTFAVLLLLVLALPLLGVLGIAFLRYDRDQSRQLLAIAESVDPLGLRLSRRTVHAVRLYMEVFDMFRFATGHFGENHVSGTIDGLTIDMFYHIASYGIGKYTIRHGQTVAIVREIGANLPDFTVAEKGWVDSLKQFAGVQYAQVPGNPEFSERFAIRGGDMENIVARLTSAVVKLIETYRLTVESLDGCLLIVLRKGRLAPEEYRSTAEIAIALADAFRGPSVRTTP